ncbi:CHAT domain-containing protein [Fibrella forsythiae]|uniref:CHAT domain-containing protein n=1 Tax=Fibrella forsythiae TaxID=2817061 RepID=A0ABS3JNC3_9BACT|nr:CHAT domain-containing protein [Fibrella forsythiae]MBO0950911.1 CHAT domain-containing protein [Fibrella forsythiae]
MSIPHNHQLTKQVVSHFKLSLSCHCGTTLRQTLWGICVLAGWIMTPAYAQSSWQTAADSSARFLADGDYTNAYRKGLQAALLEKPVQQADSVWLAVSLLARRLPDSAAVTTALKAGQYYVAQYEYDRALTYIQRSLQKSDSLHLPQYQLQARLIAARVAIRKQDVDKAKSLYRWVLRDTLARVCMDCQVDALIGLASLYVGTRPDSSLIMVRQGMATLQQIPNYQKSQYYPLIHGVLAQVAAVSGDLTTAIQEIDESYTSAKSIMPDNPLLTGIAFMYAQIMGDVNDEKALEATRTARKLLNRQSTSRKHPYYCRLLNNEIGLLRVLGRNPEAVLLADSIMQRHSLDELMSLSGSDLLLSQITRSYIEAKQDGNLDQIAQKAQQLLTLNDHKQLNPSFLYSLLGRYYQYKGNYTEAVRCLKEEARLDSLNMGATLVNYSLVNRLAVCQAQAGQRSDAYTSFSQLVSAFDRDIRTNLWLMSDAERDNYLQTTVISGLFWHLLRRSDPEPNEIGLAFDYKLLQQGVRLKMNRTINRFTHTRNQSDSSMTTVRQLMNVRMQLADQRMATQSAAHRQLQQTADSLERLMGKDAITLDNTLKTVHWQDIRNRLKPGEAAVELIWYTTFSRNGQTADSGAYSAFLIRPEWATPKVIQLVTPDDQTNDFTGEKLAASREPTYYTSVIFSRTNQKKRFTQFWQPIATALGPVKRLYIALDGQYQQLSLPTIQNPVTGRYLTDDMDIVVLNSTQDILEPPSRSSNRTAELVGHPAYSLVHSAAKKPGQPTRQRRQVTTRNGLTFEELPYSKVEVQQLSGLFTSFNLQPRLRTDEAASESAFQQMKSPRLLHVATHGYLRDPSTQLASNQLLTCGLVLAGAADTVRLKNQTDGILTGYEASLLNLHDTELVVLSACESGVGAYSEGEGINGLQRAFLLAGARSVLVSLWRVNDQLTQQLMTDFYRYWLTGASKSQALHKAQLNLRKQHPNPYYWGAFVLVGQ